MVEDEEKKRELSRAAINQEFVRSAGCVFVFCGGRLVNVSCAIQNLLLAAHALGLEECWVGSFDRRSVRDILGIPEEVDVHALVPVGKPKEVPTDPGKRLPEEIAHFGRWGNRRITADTLRRVVETAEEKVAELREKITSISSAYGEESYPMYRLEEKYAAFVFRPLLLRICDVIEELGVEDKLLKEVKNVVAEYERGEGLLGRRGI